MSLGFDIVSKILNMNVIVNDRETMEPITIFRVGLYVGKTCTQNIVMSLRYAR